MPDEFLVADIGATNARAQRCEWTAGTLRLVGDAVVRATSSYADGAALFADLLAAVELERPAGALLAIAGPQRDGCYTVTNASTVFDPAALARRGGCDVSLRNDFHALARGVPEFHQLTQIGGGVSEPGPRAVLGPGSGLGMASVVLDSAGRWLVLPGEGGHAALAPGNHLEAELWNLLSSVHEHVSWETVLSGPGLVNLYRAVATLWGAAPADLGPDDITARAVDVDDPVCHQTLESFCGLLGTAASSLALTVGAVGGVYLGGGILPRIKGFLLTSPMRRRFEERGVMTEYVARIPIYLIDEPAPGLVGALHCLADTLTE